MSVSIIAFGSTAAHADGIETGGGLSQPGTVPIGTNSEMKQAKAKLDLVRKEFAASRGGDLKAAKTARLAYVQKYGQSALGTASTLRTVSARASGSATITTGAFSVPITQLDQVDASWCGPAAAEVVLKNVHPGVSAYDGVTLTQAHLAAPAYLNTASEGATSWANGRMKVGLNRWIGKTFYIDAPSPSAADFKAAVYSDLYNYIHPFVTDNVEIANSDHYNHHPTAKTIGHWTTVYGYTANVASTKFTDSSHSSAVSWGDLPAEYFTYNTIDFANNFLQNNGITY